jgi:hypothetical protein
MVTKMETKNVDYKSLKGIRAGYLKACFLSAYDGFNYLHNPSEPTDSVELGLSIHARLESKEKFDAKYITEPSDAPRRLPKPFEEYKKITDEIRACHEYWQAFDNANFGKIILDPKKMELINLIVNNCSAIPHVKAALETFEKEKIFQWSDNGIDFKAQLDLVSVESGAIIDIKTTSRGADQRSFLNQVIYDRIDIQLYHYAKAMQDVAPNLYIIAIETNTGQVACYNVTNIVYSDFTKKRYEQALKTALEVLKMKECPAKFSPEVIELNLPKWAFESETV